MLEYPIVSIEDPFDKEDWEHVKHFSSLGLCQVGLIVLLVIFLHGPLRAFSVHITCKPHKTLVLPSFTKADMDISKGINRIFLVYLYVVSLD